MALRNTIAIFLKRRNVTPYRFWKDLGISKQTAYDLYNVPERIPTGEVIDRICEFYKIQPGELLQWIPNSELEELPKDSAG